MAKNADKEPLPKRARRAGKAAARSAAEPIARSKGAKDVRASAKYEVGYCKPPREHQYKKGQSGNPKGRGRKKPLRLTVVRRSIGEEVLAQGDCVIARGNGKHTELRTVQQELARQLAEDALNGDKAARKQMIDLMSRTYEEKQKERMETFRTADEYKLGWQRIFEECDRVGKPRPRVLLHPDDVIIDPRTLRVTIAGPVDAAGQAAVDACVRERDEILAQLQGDDAMKELTENTRFELVLKLIRLDEVLPPRLQKNFDSDFLDALAPVTVPHGPNSTPVCPGG